MGNRRLCQPDSLFNIGRAQQTFDSCTAVLQLECLQDAAANRIGDGVEKLIKVRNPGSHTEQGTRARNSMPRTVYFFTIGLYPSAISRARIASASFSSV